MKQAGIVRRIDDLGRVDIPKEIRRRLKIREGDPLEVYTENEGEVILRKYSPMGEMKYFVKKYIEALAQSMGKVVCITDRDEIIAVSGANSKGLLGVRISRKLEEILDKRRLVIAAEEDDKFINIIESDYDYNEYIICPIISEGDVVGSIIILNKENKEKLGETEIKMVNCAVLFLGKQFET